MPTPPWAGRDLGPRLVGAALATAAAVVVFIVVRGPGAGDGVPLTVPDGSKAPAFELVNLQDGQPAVSLATAEGRPVVLNFWASWCAPCLREMPGFEEVHRQVAGRVAFLGINHSDRLEPALALVEETGVSYPSGYDQHGTVATAFKLRGMPSTLFISADGRVLERRTGELSAAELQEVVDRLFPSGTAGPGP